MKHLSRRLKKLESAIRAQAVPLNYYDLSLLSLEELRELRNYLVASEDPQASPRLTPVDHARYAEIAAKAWSPPSAATPDIHFDGEGNSLPVRFPA